MKEKSTKKLRIIASLTGLFTQTYGGLIGNAYLTIIGAITLSASITMEYLMEK